MVDAAGLLLDDAENVVFAENQMILAADLDFGSRVLAEKDGVAGLHVELADGAVLQPLAVADGDDFALHRLLFGGVGDDDPALGFLVFFESLDDDAVL